MTRHTPEVDRWLDEAGQADLEAAVRAWCDWKGGSAA
jgi:hypothetical protein